MFRSKQKQKGISPVGVLFMMCVFGFVLLLFFKLAPHYMDYWTLRTVFTGVADIPGITKKSKPEIESVLLKRLIINSFRDFSPKRDSYVGKEDGVLTMEFDYVVKEHMIANIDVMLTFDYTVEVDIE